MRDFLLEKAIPAGFLALIIYCIVTPTDEVYFTATQILQIVFRHIF